MCHATLVEPRGIISSSTIKGHGITAGSIESIHFVVARHPDPLRYCRDASQRPLQAIPPEAPFHLPDPPLPLS
jgi:hypothetical protein